MATHLMNLHQKSFNLIKEGVKTIETRLFDEKRKEIKIGDTIEFISRESGEKLSVEVVRLSVFKKFEELFSSFPPESFGKSSKEDLFSILQYYSEEDEKRCGVVGIHIKLN